MSSRFWLEANKLWLHYNVHGAVLLSLFLQIFLIFIGPERKCRRRGIVSFLIWGAYLLTDFVAGFAIGLISRGQVKRHLLDEDLAAFWGPFLLVHQGGQDTVTAFSLEDNQLWIRSFFQLVFNLGALAYAFFRTFASSQLYTNRFRISTVLMFITGTTKCVERIWALYLACLNNFRAHMLPKPNAGFDFGQLMEEYKSKNEEDIPVCIVLKREIEREASYFSTRVFEHTPSEVVRQGFMLYKIFKGLMVDLLLNLQERQHSRQLFFQRSPEEAFQLMEVELNFMYDMFYTKMNVVHRRIGYLFRFFCNVLILVSFQQFVCFHKHELRRIDIAVSYTLFVGAIGLDLVALMRAIFSDWTVAQLQNSTIRRILCNIREKLPFKRSRWSNSMSQHNLIDYCLQEQFIWLHKRSFPFTDILDEFQYKKTREVKMDLKEHIFKELKRKAKKAESPKDGKLISSSKGEWVLQEQFREGNLLEITNEKKFLLKSVDEECEFAKSVLLWHIATDLCNIGDEQTLDDDDKKNRDNSKLLSEHMLYLLVMRPTMMSAVGGIGKIRFEDTCEEAKRNFQKFKLSKQHNFWESCKNLFKQMPSEPINNRKEACDKLMSLVTNMGYLEVGTLKGDQSVSLLFDGCMLTSILNIIDSSKRWKIMSQVWVELLAYAATHITAQTHGQQLCEGGELITFVWLLMAHFGLGQQFRINAGNARTKVVVR